MTIRDMAMAGLGWEDITAELMSRGDAHASVWVKDYILERRWK